jgi:octaprenyl-diphosphate synthase
MNQGDFLLRIEQDSELVNRWLRENLTSHVNLVSEVASHILLSGGKRLRPLLFVLTSRLCGYDGKREHYFSTVFEYLHAATLLHDDVIDNAQMRRGRQTANVLWDNSAAVLVGDFLYSKAFSMAVEMGQLDILDVLSATTTRMAEGMVLELMHTYNLDMTEQDYMEVIISKTAVLMAAACRIGGILGSTTRQEQEALNNFGLDLGIAFQMVDDTLDYTLSREQFGKPVGKDVEEGKITLPLIQALDKATPKQKARLKKLVSQGSYQPENFPKVLDLVQQCGGIDSTFQKAHYYVDKAAGSLGIFPESEYKKLMLDLADFVVRRKV